MNNESQGSGRKGLCTNAIGTSVKPQLPPSQKMSCLLVQIWNQHCWNYSSGV